MTLNVYGILNKLQAVEHYIKTNRVHIAVITETHVQENEATDTNTKGYTIVSTCNRKTGERKGGIAIYVHETIPFTNEEHRIVETKNELEYCSTLLYPNHNEVDQLAVVGVYRPPEKEHTQYDPLLSDMLRYHRERQITTILLGDFNIHSWEQYEQGFYQTWLEENDLWELSDPRVPTYRTGTVTDAVLMALGSYHPEGLLPQVVDPELDGSHPGVHPVFISDEVVLVDHHALFLDITTVHIKMLRPIKKYNIYNLTQKDWQKRNEGLQSNPGYENLCQQVTQENNIARQHHKLINLLEYTVRDRLIPTRETRDWDAEQVFERKYSAHALYTEYRLAKMQGNNRQWIEISNQMRREDWKEFLSTASTNDLRGVFHYFAKKEGRSQPFFKPSCLDPIQSQG